MVPAELKTAAEVRAHARMIQQRIDRARAKALLRIVPPPEAPAPEPPPEPKPLILPPPGAAFSVRSVFAVTAHYFAIPTEELLGPDRRAGIVFPRQIAFFVAHRLDGSLAQIARVAHRDHSTVRSGCFAIARRLNAGQREVIETINAIGEKAAAIREIKWEPVDQ